MKQIKVVNNKLVKMHAEKPKNLKHHKAQSNSGCLTLMKKMPQMKKTLQRVQERCVNKLVNHLPVSPILLQLNPTFQMGN
mmetsp:Transcript_56678/g.179130  ORF Transcript_56678/g.179130 Transcript_56678/m.179130 type:complete len:80 (-) Transcript_56678:363-602(-)